MIRFLQKDNRFVKAIFIIIITVACVTMVITLVPGIFDTQSSSANTYATIRYGGIFGRFMPAESTVTTLEVQQTAARMMQQQGLPDAVLPFVMPQVAQGLIQQHIETIEAHKLGIRANDEDVRHFLHSGMWGQILFPNGKFIGDQAYAQLISDHFNMSRKTFESQVRQAIEQDRLRALVTGWVTVSPEQVRAAYLKQALKINFQYAVLNAQTLRNSINPTDEQLEAYFKQSAARYAHAIPESRDLQYIAFSNTQIPGGAPKISDAEIEAYYNAHQSDYAVPAEAKVRHILIQVAQDAPPAAVAAARAKAESVLAQLKKDDGKNFAALAKQYSDDPGSKDQGGELGWIKPGTTVPAFDHAAFTQPVGEISNLVRTQYGFHIIQVEARQTAHTQPLSDVRAQILSTLTAQQTANAAAAYAQQLAKEAATSGLAATAAAHHLSVTTSNDVVAGANLPNLSDSSKLVAGAFAAKAGQAPGIANTGDGFAVYQVVKITPAHAPTFAAYKSQILSDYRDDQIPGLLARKTMELASKAHSLNNLAAAAKSMGATLQTSGLVKSTDQVPQIGQLSQVAPSLFNLKVGEISQAINTGQTGVVAQITDRQEPSEAEIAANAEQVRQQLLAQQQNQAFELYLSSLVDKYQKAGRIRMRAKAPSIPIGG